MSSISSLPYNPELLQAISDGVTNNVVIPGAWKQQANATVSTATELNINKLGDTVIINVPTATILTSSAESGGLQFNTALPAEYQPASGQVGSVSVCSAFAGAIQCFTYLLNDTLYLNLLGTPLLDATLYATPNVLLAYRV